VEGKIGGEGKWTENYEEKLATLPFFMEAPGRRGKARKGKKVKKGGLSRK